jgi:uncharacterized protein YndB with AHSA1/START domain
MNKTSIDRIAKRVELSSPPARVWRALTDAGEFGRWFRVNLDGPFAAGKTTRGNITYPGFEHMVVEFAVARMVPERFFSYHWHPYPADPAVDYSKEPPTLVEFTLTRTAAGTLLTVTESGFDAIPESRREEAFRMNSDGWAEQLTNIQTYLAEKPN